jgi:hypothetical protein
MVPVPPGFRVSTSPINHCLNCTKRKDLNGTPCCNRCNDAPATPFVGIVANMTGTVWIINHFVDGDHVCDCLDLIVESTTHSRLVITRTA